MSRTRLGLADAEQESRLLMRMIETISTGLDLDEIVQGTAGLITETTETDVCFVHLLDEAGRRLELRGATPPFQQLAGRVELSVGEGVSGWVAAHREPVVIIDDKLADPRYHYIPALRGEDFTSMVSVPIITGPGHLVGVLNVHTYPRREFTDADVTLLRSVAGLMGGAIENAQLHRRLADREEALEKFAARTVQLSENERRRLAGEIHDGISQRIVSLSFHLSAAGEIIRDRPTMAAREITLAQQLAEAALEETRFAIAGLRPPILDDLGIAASLESFGCSTPSLTVNVIATPCHFPKHIETEVYRIAQEALQNVAKHAQAQHAEVRLSTQGDRLLLEIIDDGEGFDPTSATNHPGPMGYGLPGMRERAELLGGELEIASSHGCGTRLRFTVPRSPAC